MLEIDVPGYRADNNQNIENLDAQFIAVQPNFPLSTIQKIKRFLSESFRSGSPAAGFVSITIASVGIGMTLIPGASTYSGLIGSLAQLVVGSLIFYYSNLLLVRSAAKRRVCSYQELSEKTYGRSLRWVTNITIFLANGLFVVFYFETISSLLALFVEAVTSNPNHWVAGPGQKVIPLLIATIFVLPLSLPKQLKQLRYLWAINLVFVLFICAVVIQQSFIYEEISNDPKMLVQINFSGFAKTFPSIVFALYHYNSLDVFGELTSSSKKIMKRVVIYNRIFIFFIHVLMIIFGYITFSNFNLQKPEYINRVILINYNVAPDGGTRNLPGIVVVCLLLMVIILTTKMSVFIIPAKDSIQDFFFPKTVDRYGEPIDTVPSPYVHFTFVAIIIYLCAISSIFIKNQSIIEITNIVSFIWVMHGFIFPAVFYITLPKEDKKYKHEKISQILIFTMTVFVVYNTYVNIADMF